jgi:hypothetical protein
LREASKKVQTKTEKGISGWQTFSAAIINQGTYARHHSSTKAQSGRIPFLGGNKKRVPFLGTLAPALTKAGGKQKGTNKNLPKNFALSGKTLNFIPASSLCNRDRLPTPPRREQKAATKPRPTAEVLRRLNRASS